jgi:hypothetical protein
MEEVRSTHEPAGGIVVTLHVYRADGRGVRAHEYAGDCLYLGDVELPRERLPLVRAGQRLRLAAVARRWLSG